MLLRGYPPIILIYLIPVILVSITFHEVSHAYISYKLGDPTAKNYGRLSLNPLRHLDILGTIMILVSGFGWAKPVPINPTYYQDKKKGTMLVSLAGPLSNIMLALLFSFPMAYIAAINGIDVSKIFDSGIFYFSERFDFQSVIFNLSRFFFMINISLAIFNIIPVPPLDGSKILAGILPPAKYLLLVKYENYISIAFLLLVFLLPGALSTIMAPLRWVVETAIRFVVSPVINLLV